MELNLTIVNSFGENDTFEHFRTTLFDLSKNNFDIIDKKLSELNKDNMLQIRIDKTNSCKYLFYYYEGDNVDFIKGLDTSNVTNMQGMFISCSNLTTIPLIDTSNVTIMYSMFQYCSNLTTIPQLDTSKVVRMDSMFSYCSSLISVPELDASNVYDMSNMFNSCYDIEEIHMINIGADLTLNSCTKMTREALLEVIGNLKDLTGSTSKKLTLGSTNLAKLTDEDKAIATNKNWTLA